jgi:small subunit ribosomal protein S11
MTEQINAVDRAKGAEPKTDQQTKPGKPAPQSGEAAQSETPAIKIEKKKKSKRRSIVEGNIYIDASFNNTIVTVAEPNGNAISWSSAGSSGFKGARKATPYAAQVAAENAVQKAKIYGLERAHVFVKGVGNGREQALRGISLNQIDILSITDTTAIPHNGCRKKKARRV